jgi:hypothetical protein
MECNSILKGEKEMDEKILDIILDNVRELKIDMVERMDRIENKIDNVVTKEDCEAKRANCTNKETLEIRKNEVSIKKIIAIGGVVTGTLTASTTAIVTILKIVYS